MAEKANDDDTQQSETDDTAALIGGTIGQIMQAGKKQGPAFVALLALMSAGGVAFYNAVQWVGAAVVAPIADQHVKTLMLLQTQAVEHTSTLRSIEKSLDKAIVEHSNKLELIHLEIKRLVDEKQDKPRP